MYIPETRIKVDDFTTADAGLYTLTHYHSDHRKGLKKRDNRLIVCSVITKQLLVGLQEIPENNLISIEPGTEVKLPDGLRIKAFDANHCPGAVMFLFKVNGKKHLHTGDFRYCKAHDRYSELFENIDTLFVDSTFQSDTNRYNHPSQEDAIEQIIDLIKKNPEKTVFIGLYQIGKNKIIQAIYQRLGVKVGVSEEKRYVYSLMGMDEAVTTDNSEARIKGYAMSYFYCHFRTQYPDYIKDSIVILPTGWSHSMENSAGYYYIPYSEHNSSSELRRFIEKVNAKSVVETNISGGMQNEVSGKREKTNSGD